MNLKFSICVLLINCLELIEHKINENLKLLHLIFQISAEEGCCQVVLLLLLLSEHITSSYHVFLFIWLEYVLITFEHIHSTSNKGSVQFFTFGGNVGCSIAPCRINHPKKAAQSISNNISDTGMLWAAGLWQLKEANSFFVLIAIHASCCRLAPLIIQLNKLPIKQKVESRRARREQACQLQRARTCIDPVGFTPLNTSH